MIHARTFGIPRSFRPLALGNINDGLGHADTWCNPSRFHETGADDQLLGAATKRRRPIPAVVLLHGCSGWHGRNVSDWANWFRDRGYVALAIDSLSTTRVPHLCDAKSSAKTWKPGKPRLESDGRLRCTQLSFITALRGRRACSSHGILTRRLRDDSCPATNLLVAARQPKIHGGGSHVSLLQRKHASPIRAPYHHNWRKR